MTNRALLTGITGQDGSYLAEFLLDKGYEVHGLIRRASGFNTVRIEHIRERLTLHYGDITDGQRVAGLLAQIRPTEVYNLAAQSHVAVSFDNPVYTAQVVAIGTVTLLEAIRQCYPDHSYPRVYQASSSEMFGNGPAPQSETTPFAPRSPYACAKVHAHLAAVNYREAYDVPVSCGILFNHESPRRGETFVTRKITRAVGRIKAGIQDRLGLGWMGGKRDWGWAPDYVEAMWLMLRAEPDDFVIATGTCHAVCDFLQMASDVAGIDWQQYVYRDERYHRPSDVFELRGDASKAMAKLGWKPRVGFEEIVRRMVEADVELAEREAR